MKDISLTCDSLFIDKELLTTTVSVGPDTGRTFFSYYMLFCIGQEALSISFTLCNNEHARSYLCNDGITYALYADPVESNYIFDFFELEVLSGLSSRSDNRPCAFNGYFTATIGELAQVINFVYNHDDSLSLRFLFTENHKDTSARARAYLKSLYR
jgi:hypothetical protein